MAQHIGPKTYYKVFAALMVLLVLTVVVAYIPFPGRLGRLSIVLAMLIAIVKAVLVVLFFMHIRGSSRLTKVFVVAGLAWLTILMSITLIEYHSRPWLTGNAPVTVNPQLR
jgi:cytochrome c oxidase subunit 4